MNRRQFLSTTAAGLALSAARGWAVPYADQKRRRVGLIGTGWYGKCDLLRLIQIAPIEVVSLCDVDKQMVAEAADIVSARQTSKKRPRTFHDYRDMLKEKDLDLVLIATPDHWHALPMIAAVESGLDVYVQKPISVDIVEGQAMLAAARKHQRVVQVGTQRRSTPHLVEAMENFIKPGKLGKIGLVEVYCYYHMRRAAPLCPDLHHALMGDMCIHMFDMVRWMMDLGWPTRVSSAGGTLVDKASKANITDTQTATFDYPDLKIVWEHRTWGESPDPKYPWGATFYGDKGTLKASVYGYDFTPESGTPVHRDVTYEFEQYPEDKTEKDLERHVAPAIRHHMQNFLAAIDSRGKPVADIEQGYMSTTSCILANLAMKLGRTLTWDAGDQRVAGDEEANRLLRRPYRQPWVHPEVERA